MPTQAYKSFVIEAAPHELRDSHRWTINGKIIRDREGKVRERAFTAADDYESRAEAIEHCFNFGRQIIDGRVPGLSVADL